MGQVGGLSDGGAVSAIALLAGAAFLTCDIVLVLAYCLRKGGLRERLLEPWSLLDLFLGLQFAFFAVMMVVSVAMIGLHAAYPGSTQGRASNSPIVTFFALFGPVLLLQHTSLMLVPIALVRIKYRQSIAALGLRWDPDRSLKHLLLGALLALPVLPVADLLELISRQVILEQGSFPGREFIRGMEPDTTVLGYMQGIRHHPVALPLMVVLLGLIGPVAEEVFFRGFAYRIFKRRWGFRIAAGLSALLFAGVHVNIVAVLPILFSGYVLAWLFERTGSLFAPIGLHCTNNLVTLAFLLLAPEFRFWRDWIHL